MDFITFDINVTNTGKVPLDQVTVVDSLPEGMEYNNSNPNGTIKGRNITWNINGLNPGESKNIDLIAQINDSASGIIWNEVNATGLTPAGEKVADNGNDSVDVISCANITVTKTANPSSGCPLDFITFDINVTNTGKVPLDQVTVVDSLPEGMEYNNSNPNGTIKGRNITWNINGLNPGESKNIDLIAQINDSASGIIWNEVNATGLTPAREKVTDNGNDSVDVISCANITVTKTANPSSGCPLDFITFDINVTNTGKVPLDQVTVVDSLPEGMEYNNSNPNGTIKGRNITWNINGLNPGESKNIDLIAQINDSASGIIWNEVNATGLTPAGEKVTDNGNDSVDVISCANITVTKTANPSSGCPLDFITFDINVTNTGKVPLDQVTVVDSLPEGMEYNNSNPNGTIKGRNITWNLEEPLLVGKSKNIKLIAQINDSASGILWNEVNATGLTPAGEKVADNGNDSVDVISCANITVTKTANPSSGCPLDFITFDINVTNTGKVPLDQVTVVDSLPEGMEYNNSNPNGTIKGRNITWNINGLNPGESKNIDLIAQINDSASGIIWNEVNATGLTPAGEKVADNGNDSVDVISCANITVTKTANPSSGCPLDFITFDINVTNTGKVPLDQVTVVDSLPEGMEYNNSNPNGTIKGRNITWNINGLNPGESKNIKLIAQINDSASGILWNEVNATGLTPAGEKVADNGNDSVDVISCANITVTKTANPSSGCPLDFITFDINVTNTGKVPLDQVTVVDSLPEGMEYNNSNPNGTIKGRNITWNINGLNPGESKNIDLIAQINDSASGIIWNEVNATGRHQNGNVTAHDNETVEVMLRCANISIEKSVSPSSGYPQTIAKFIIKVTNTGNQPLNPVIVKDALPKGLNFVDSTPEGIKDGQNISWTLPQLDPGKSEYIKLLAQIDMFASGTLQNWVNAIGRSPKGINVTDIDIEPVEVIGCVPIRSGSACWNCCNECCKCPGNTTINLNNSGQGIQVVSIDSGDVRNLSQESKSLVE